MDKGKTDEAIFSLPMCWYYFMQIKVTNYPREYNCYSDTND
jgi:hypothetical protein